MAAPRRAYDHRIRELICEGADPKAAQHLNIPRPTVASWRRRGPRSVVTLEEVTKEATPIDAEKLQAELLKLQRRNDLLTAIIKLLFLLVQLSGATLDDARLPDGDLRHPLK